MTKSMTTFDIQDCRTVYPDFVHRFIIIKPKEVHAAQPDLKQCTSIILSSIEAMNDKWR